MIRKKIILNNLARTHRSQAQLDGQRTEPSTTATILTGNRTLVAIKRQTQAIMQHAEAASTQRNRDYLLLRLRQFAQTHSLPLDRRTAMLFATATTNTKASTKLTYLSTLMARLEPGSELQLYRRGLRRISAQEELNQAPPMTREQLHTIMREATPDIQLPLLLGWKTASRIDELAQLTGQQIRIYGQSIVIDWGANTKASALDPHHACLLVEVREPKNPLAYPIAPLRQLAQIVIGRKTPVFPQPVIDTLRELLTRHGLRGHSIKSGAITELLQHAADGKLDANIIPLLAKHRQQQPPLPSTTIRYIRDRVGLALALRTGLATELL